MRDRCTLITSSSSSSTSMIDFFTMFLFWPCKNKTCSISRRRNQTDGTAAFFYDLLYNSQSDASAFGIRPFAQGLKESEHFFMVFRADARAVVGNGKFVIVFMLLTGHADLRLWPRIFYSIAKQVAEDLL